MRRLPLASLLVLALSAGSAFAQSGANVLLVANESSDDSIRIADHYARTRSVPQEQVLRIKVQASDEVDRATFERDVQLPIANWLARTGLHDRILYIVLTKGVPLRIRGTGGRDGTVSSVDSELTLAYRRMSGIAAPIAGAVPNPYFLGTAPVSQARLFTHAAQDIFLVTRLDGFSVEDVLALIDRGVAPSSDGRILLDQKGGLAQTAGDQWLKAAADVLAASGLADRVVLETTSRALTAQDRVLGYYSWGSNDPGITVRHIGLGFLPGALAGLFVSTDARTFTAPPAEWKVGPWSDRSKFYAGSPQSLTGDLVREGVTGVAGHVAEPFLDASIRPDVLFPAYVSGFNLAESYYLAMPFLSWQAVVIGDPLCAPFPRKALQPAEIDPGTDPATALPAFFSARRLRAAEAASPGVERKALQAMLRSEALGARNDKAGSRAALEEAAKLDPRLAAAHILLASEHERNGEYDLAIERYRAVLDTNPNHAATLNNLAYALAVRKGQPAEALGFAQKAYAVAPAPVIGDTLGWIQHLLGRDAEAAPLLANAARALPDNPEVHLHAAVVFAAVGMLDSAAKELADAVRLDPALEESEEARALRARLK